MDTIYIIDSKLTYKPAEHTLYLNDTNESLALAVSASLCLYLLLENQGNTVSRNVLLESVWGSRGMNVTPNTLYQNISLLRKSFTRLGVNSPLIETVPRRGFTFSKKASVVKTVNNQEKINHLQQVHSAEGSPTHVIASGPNKEHQSQSASAVKERNHILKKIHPLLIILFLSLSGVWALTDLKSEDHFDSYHFFMSLDNCKLYRNNSLHITDDYYIDFIDNNNVSCSGKKNIYITNHYPSKRLSIISCQHPINVHKKPDCISAYYF